MASHPGASSAPGAPRRRCVSCSDILEACRADPARDAPLVHALIGATDPETGRALSDLDICNDLIAFMVAGHDPTGHDAGLRAVGTGPPSRDPEAESPRRPPLSRTAH